MTPYSTNELRNILETPRNVKVRNVSSNKTKKISLIYTVYKNENKYKYNKDKNISQKVAVSILTL